MFNKNNTFSFVAFAISLICLAGYVFALSGCAQKAPAVAVVDETQAPMTMDATPPAVEAPVAPVAPVEPVMQDEMSMDATPVVVK